MSYWANVQSPLLGWKNQETVARKEKISQTLKEENLACRVEKIRRTKEEEERKRKEESKKAWNAKVRGVFPGDDDEEDDEDFDERKILDELTGTHAISSQKDEENEDSEEEEKPKAAPVKKKAVKKRVAKKLWQPVFLFLFVWSGVCVVSATQLREVV